MRLRGEDGVSLEFGLKAMAHNQKDTNSKDIRHSVSLLVAYFR